MASLVVKKSGNTLVGRLGGRQHCGMVAVGTASTRMRPGPRLFSLSPSTDKHCATPPQQTTPPPPPLQDDSAAYKQGMEQLKQTNPYLHRMAPTRGGTDLPDAKFVAVFAVVAGAGFYSWFIHDPEKKGNGAK